MSSNVITDLGECEDDEKRKERVIKQWESWEKSKETSGSEGTLYYE
jgi:hypothetical protein